MYIISHPTSTYYYENDIVIIINYPFVSETVEGRNFTVYSDDKELLRAVRLYYYCYTSIHIIKYNIIYYNIVVCTNCWT